MKYKLIILLAIVFSLNLITSAKISCPFDTTQNVSCGNTGITYAGSLVFEVTTVNDVLCRYSSVQGTSYNLMNSFSDNFYTVHKKEFSSLSDGVYKYYVKCRNITNINNESDGINELNAVFKISNPISANIEMPASPLTSGKYEIKVQTTKIPLTPPKLWYSYDGSSYTPMVLYGSASSWKGYLIVDSSPEEKIGSFKFESTDLEGRTGTDIYGTSIFMVDTLPPKTINVFDATGEYQDIKLEWFNNKDDDSKYLNIYRSENPNVDISELYKKIDSKSNYYVDQDVEKGKTYYYRIALEDDAGNIASLSREAKATALTNEIVSTNNGLSAELFGKVDSLLVQLNIVSGDLLSSQSSFNSGNDIKDYLESLSITENFQSSKSELNALKSNIDSLKSQDLTEELLDSRLSAFEAKLNIIKKKIPQSYSVLEEKEENQEITDDLIRTTILEKSPDITPTLLDKSIKNSRKIIDTKELKVKNHIKSFEIIYLDGTREVKSVINHVISSKDVKTDDYKLLLILPTGIVDSGSIKLKNLDYEKLKDNLLSFSSDTKEIVYSVGEKVDLDSFSSINLIPSSIVEESPALTGYFLSNISSGSSGITLLLLVVLGLLGYLFYSRSLKVKESTKDFLLRARRVKNLYAQGKTSEANNLYELLKSDYLLLSQIEKKKVFKEVRDMTR